jgi:hypothetical protein
MKGRGSERKDLKMLSMRKAWRRRNLMSSALKHETSNRFCFFFDLQYRTQLVDYEMTTDEVS